MLPPARGPPGDCAGVLEQAPSTSATMTARRMLVMAQQVEHRIVGVGEDEDQIAGARDGDRCADRRYLARGDGRRDIAERAGDEVGDRAHCSATQVALEIVD